jgi:hypothetical protein
MSYAVPAVAANTQIAVNGPPSVTVKLRALPPQGVVEKAYISTGPFGKARERVARGIRVLYATFRFSVLPRKGRPLTVTWTLGRFKETVKPDRPARRTVTAQIGSVGAGTLVPGRWTATLRSGKKVVATTRVRVG